MLYKDTDGVMTLPILQMKKQSSEEVDWSKVTWLIGPGSYPGRLTLNLFVVTQPQWDKGRLPLEAAGSRQWP